MTSQTQDLVITNTSSIPPSNTISFGYVKEEDVRVELGTTVSNRTLISYTSDWTITSDNKVQLASSLFSATGTYKLKIYRQTNTSSLAHTFQVGSSIKAEDLNNSYKQAIFAAEENTNSINSLATGNASGSIQIDGSNIADNSINSNKIINLQVKTADLDNDAVTTDKLANDSVTTDKLANSINSAITANTAKVTNATHTGDVTGSTTLTISDNAVTTSKIQDGQVTQAKLNSAVIFTPVGTVIWFLGARPPVGYLKCNGQTINNGNTTISGNYIDNTAIGTVDTSALYSIIGGLIPDLRGEFIRAWDDGRNIDVGRALNSFQMDAVQNHEHEFGSDDQVASQGGYTNVGTFAYDATSNTAGGGQRLRTKNQTGRVNTQTRPRNVSLLACIKY